MSTITSANSIISAAIPDVYPAPQQLQGYAVDDAWATESVEMAVAQMGVDALMSAGFTPFVTKITFAFQADSPSIALFQDWGGAMQAAREVFFGDFSIMMPSVGRVYTCTKGAMTGYKPLVDGKKVLGPAQYVVTFESVVAGNV